MPRVVDSTRKKDAENGVHEDGLDKSIINRCEMIVSLEDVVSSDETYILELCGTHNEPEFRVCAALSNYSCVVYNVGESLSKTLSLSHHSSPIIGVKFSSHSKHILYTATQHGFITACDLRAKGKIVAELKGSYENEEINEMKDNSSEGKLKPLASFDISSDDRLVAAGTEHVGGDAFILFWDIRYNNSKPHSRNNLLGGYWESHMDDVTSLQFHPTKADIVASGSTDGLINVFDLTQTSEDTALNYSLNTESSVDRVGWLEDGNLWCTTHTHSLQLWECEDASPFIKYDRGCIANFLNEDQDNCYLVKMHKAESGEYPFLIAGSNSVKGDNLTGVIVDNDDLEVCYDFVGNKQVVRDSWRHNKSGILITGGESGVLNLWKQSESVIISRPDCKLISKPNGKTRHKQHRTKPY